ncbi:Uncharacterised protein [Mycolicibacterium vanbaalenii]|uniref:Uncharacterized protein n=1 Tax=Mycolicibacterium vanbaalenii TaxID=110539 RepID=A0A5S9QSZ5_MYCVN|nr:Uncharacterised protein [Mycolicibacterium vanbaalenii]
MAIRVGPIGHSVIMARTARVALPEDDYLILIG